MKLKRITYFLLTFSLLTCMFISSSIKTNATTLSTVSYSVDNTYIQVGQTFNIYVNAQSIIDLYGASVDFKYDTSILKISDITQGVALASSGKTYSTVIKSPLPDTTGTVSMGLSLQGSVTGSNVSGQLFVIKAIALKTGTVNLKTTEDSSQLTTTGTNMCVKLANSTTDTKITGVTYPNSSFTITSTPPMNSEIVSYNFPAIMLPGQSYPVRIVVKNTGTDTWTAAKNYKLAPVGYSDPFTKYKLVLSPSDNVQPGQTKTYTYTMKAPLTQGTYTTDWQMYKEGIAWFGQKLVRKVVVASPPRASLIVSNTIPTTMLRGKNYNVKIVVKNTGSDTWTAAKNYKLAPVGYSDPFHNYKLTLSSNESILPGQTKTFSFSMKAPSTKGTFTSDWQMYVERTVWFGQSVVKHIIVK